MDFLSPALIVEAQFQHLLILVAAISRTNGFAVGVDMNVDLNVDVQVDGMEVGIHKEFPCQRTPT